MGILKTLHLRGDQQPQEDNPTDAGVVTTAVGTRRYPSAQEAENRRDKGIDIDMIDPEEIIQELKTLAHGEWTETQMVGEAPNIQVLQIKHQFDRPWAIAALGYLNKVWPTIWMSTFEADTTKLRIRTAFHDIRKSMSTKDKKEYSIVLKMVRDLCLARCEDMKEGHKPLLLKVKREELGVHMTRGQPLAGQK